MYISEFLVNIIINYYFEPLLDPRSFENWIFENCRWRFHNRIWNPFETFFRPSQGVVDLPITKRIRVKKGVH